VFNFDDIARQLAQEIQQLEAQQQQIQVMLIGRRAQLDLVAQLRADQQAATPAPAEADAS
jgi:hypothetical protein